MENLNAEQVKKALECCGANDGCVGEKCPYYEKCLFCITRMSKDALAIINSQEQRIEELTRMMQDNVRAENEELRKSNECDVRRLKTDTVKDFHKRFYEKLVFMNINS